jgi:hypothetical protein
LAWCRRLSEDPRLQQTVNWPLGLLAGPGQVEGPLAALAAALDNATLHVGHAFILRELGRTGEAVAALRRSLQAPWSFLRLDRVARMALAELLWIQSQTAAGPVCWELQNEAREQMHWLAGSGTFPPSACGRLANLAAQMGDGAAALAWAEMWQRQAPQDAAAASTRFAVELLMHAYDRAAATAELYHQKRPQETEFLTARAGVAVLQRDWAGALSRALELRARRTDDPNAATDLRSLEGDLLRRRAEAPFLLAKLRQQEALTAALRGDHAAARQKALAAAKGRDDDGDALAALACVLARAADAAEHDPHLTGQDRDDAAELCAAEAAAALNRAEEIGYLKDAWRTLILQQERDLDPLRNRNDIPRALRRPAR